MTLFKRLLRFVFSFRLFAVTVLLWILFNTQSQAWQPPVYRPYPIYLHPVNYRPSAYPQPQQYVAPGYARNRYSVNHPGRYQPVNYISQPAQSGSIGLAVTPASKKLSKKSNINSSKISTGPGSKQQFINKLLPLIKQQNSRLKTLRKQLIRVNSVLLQGGRISDHNTSWLIKLANKYKVKGDPLTNESARKELLSRVDIIPASLTLAQAANESAWGKSRFATEANNLFGIWTYDPKKGLKPKNRTPGKKHLVRKFSHPADSVSYYMHTLNTHRAYKKLRDIRQQLRAKQQSVNGMDMAKGLENYSARGNLYIQSIQRLIRQNEWAQLDHANQSV